MIWSRKSFRQRVGLIGALMHIPLIAYGFAALAASPLPTPLPDASPTLRGAVNTSPQTWSGTKKQKDSTLQGTPARSLLHPDVVVTDFGGCAADGTTDCLAGVVAAMNSFGPANDSFCGKVVFPKGTYRLSDTVHVKKACHFHGASGYQGVIIKPDPGITAFKTERYNTYTVAGSGSGDGARFSQMTIYNAAHKVPVRSSAGETLSLGARRKMGPQLNQGLVVFTDTNEFYRHYQVTTAGTTDPATDGPHSFGNDQTLTYGTQTANFHKLDFITGATTGAFGRVTADADSGASGTLRLTSTSSTLFQAGEIITDTHGGSATAGGAQTPATQDELDGTVRWKYIGPGAGIHIRTGGVVMEDVYVDNMSGNGVHIAAGDLECLSCFVNANGWQAYNLNISTCDGHGMYLRGSDSNGGSWHGGQVGGNGGATSDEQFSGTGFNIYEASFLGNTYSGIELYTGAGHGGIFVNNAGGGSTFTGCYVEGSPMNYAVTPSVVVQGGGLSVNQWVSSGLATGSNTWSPAAISIMGPTVSLPAQFGIPVGALQIPGWRRSVTMLTGLLRTNDSGKVYQCITPGITASSGGPTGTGSDITDGTVHWQYALPAIPIAGAVSIGGYASSDKSPIETVTTPDDALGQGSVNYDAWEATNNPMALRSRTSRYNFSGSVGRCYPDAYNLGRMRAANNTTLSGWPMHVPAGHEFWRQMWIGYPGTRITFETSSSDPVCGIWNAGDRMYYAGAAVSAGGNEGKICVSAGTAGTYGGGRTITCNGSSTTCTVSGAAMSTLYDQHDFWVGDYLKISGGATRHVTSQTVDGLSLTFDAAPSVCNACAVTFANPTFKTFGSIAP